MADTVLSKPEPEILNRFLRTQAAALRARDEAPASLRAWEERRPALREALFAAMGPLPEKSCAFEPQILGVLERKGYRIEKLVYQTRPDVWVTASAYVPDPVKGKLPAVLCVHGHWSWARREPVVQARCIGLAKLGFFVLCPDAFGSGERYTTPTRGTYHGALYGSTLWPTGLTLLGLQVYDNRRAVDYLLGRTEVDGKRLGITGASGGGNQTMYAGALDERFRAVVPVCSVGNYQAYLHTGCCVCEMLPGALRFTEEGDVLGLTAPRALLVINASKDGIQFSPAEADKSLARARAIFKLFGTEDHVKHTVFESGHDYSRPMREAMYGWMTRWLKEEGDGSPLDEPEHEVEKPADLACYPAERPRSFLLLPALAGREGRALLERAPGRKPEHVEDWESTATYLRTQLRKQVFGDFPKPPRPDAKLGAVVADGSLRTSSVLLYPEPDLPLPVRHRYQVGAKGVIPACVLLHLDGKEEALKHPLATALVEKNWAVLAPDLRGTGETQPADDGGRNTPDHNSTEHSVWIGRPLLGQWVFDVQHLLDWLALQPGLDRRHVAVVGLGQAGLVALCAGALLEERIATVGVLDTLVSFVTDEAYAPGTHMGLLAPGILRVGDVPQLAALAAPRKLVIAGGSSPQGEKLEPGAVREAFAFTRGIYRVYRKETQLAFLEEGKTDELVGAL